MTAELIKFTFNLVAGFVAEAGGFSGSGSFNGGPSSSNPLDDDGSFSNDYFNKAFSYTLSSDKASSTNALVIYNLARNKPACNTTNNFNNDDNNNCYNVTT